MFMRKLFPIVCGIAVLTLSAGTALADEGPCEIADITWKLGPNMPEFRKGGCATALGGKIVSVFGMRQPWGEMATMYIFDPRVQRWERGPDGPIGQTYVQGTELGGAFYSIGGRSSAKGGVHNQCYRLSSNDGKYAWEQIAGLNQRRGWAPSVSVDGKLYVFGGSQSGRGPTLGSVEMLDTSDPKSKWRKVAEIPGPSRGWSGAAAAGGKIYLIGGAHRFSPKPANGPDRKLFNEVWQFDPATHRWQAGSPLPYRLSGFDCCAYANRYVIVVGGCVKTEDFTDEMRSIQQRDRFNKSYYCPFVLIYDTEANRWHRMPSVMPVPTNDIRVVLHDDKLYALGGENIEPATSNTTPWLRIGRIHPRKEQVAKHLVLDSRIIEKTDGVALRLGKVEKDRHNPLFAEGKPWEVRFDNMYPNVMFDREDGIYKCWYSPFIIDKATSTATEEIKKRMTYCKALKHQREMAVCYATSKDGIVWKKPTLGICDYDGSTENNIVKRKVHGAGVFKDYHESNPACRYKMFLERGGMGVCFSADGLHWSEVVPRPEIKAAGDTHNNVLWDKKSNRYVGITRMWADGQRVVGRTESRDFIDWSKAKEVFRGMEPHLQIYAMPVFRYANVYLGLAMIFNTKTDQVDCELTWSADTVHWQRVCAGSQFIPRGVKGSYDSGCIYAAAYPVLRDGQIRLYYGGNDAQHCGWRKGHLCLARLRADGFAGMQTLDPEIPGTIITKPIRCTGGQLRVTADTSGGRIRAAVLDADGLTFDACRPITTDVTDGVVKWNGAANLNSFQGKKIQLKFELKAAKLYAFGFDDS